jgi:hypothetical protein
MSQILDDLFLQGAGLEQVGYRANREAGRYADHPNPHPPGNDSRGDTSQHDDIPDGGQRACGAVLVTAQPPVPLPLFKRQPLRAQTSRTVRSRGLPSLRDRTGS